VDLEFRALCQHEKDEDGLKFLKFLFVWIGQQLQFATDFELLQAYLYRAVLIYSEILRTESQFADILKLISKEHDQKQETFRDLLKNNLCLLKLFAKIPPI